VVPLIVSRVTDGVLPLLGVAPLLGRSFSREDDRAGNPPTVVLRPPDPKAEVAIPLAPTWDTALFDAGGLAPSAVETSPGQAGQRPKGSAAGRPSRTTEPRSPRVDGVSVSPDGLGSPSSPPPDGLRDRK